MITDTDRDKLARETSAELGIVGAQIAVLRGRDLRRGVAGVANLATSLPVTVDTMFQIGSKTKIFTAALVMALIEKGLIGLDVPVVEQLAGFALADQVAQATVTPRHLMSMSSGITSRSRPR